MAHNTHLSNVAVNACLDNALNALNGGTQPAVGVCAGVSAAAKS